MCNANPKSFTPRPYLLDANYVRYVDEEALDPSTNLDPAGWDNTVSATTGGVTSCRTHVETRIFKPCVHDMRGMSISMDGVLAKNFPNYCRCFLREWVRSEVSDPEPVDTPAPTSSPTMSPSARPTSRPTIAPTKSPSASPSYVPTSFSCDYESVIITELASPTLASAKYIELLFLDEKCRGAVIRDPIKIIKFASGECDPDSNPNEQIDLAGTQIGDDGFVTVCNSGYFQSECTIVRQAADLSGTDTIAIISGDIDDGFDFVDVFGIPCQANPDSEFRNGRAVRNIDIDTAQKYYNPSNWIILPGACGSEVGPADTDINQWVEVQEAICPTNSPTTESQGDCEFFLTELADYPGRPFVEIKSTCPGITISRSISVVSYKENGPTREIDLSGVVVPDDGFIIICHNKMEHETSYGNACNFANPLFLVGHGHNSYAIVHRGSDCGAGGCDDRYLDVYGFVGESLEDTPHSYKRHRMVRKIQYNYGISPCNFDAWELVFITGSPPENTSDPRSWTLIPTDMYFTEFCDPNEEPNKRFIELYSPNKRDYVIMDNLFIVKYVNGDATQVSLKGNRINENGYLVLCQSFSLFGFGSQTCQIQTGFSSVASFSGDERFELTKCQNPATTNNCEVLDAFDYQSQTAVDSRAHRFDPSEQWVVRQNVSSSECDPGMNNNLPIPAPATPAPTPPGPTPTAPAPTPSSSSKGYPSKGKGKSKRIRRAK